MRPVPDKVRIVEVGPRDGLQFEPSTLDHNIKIELIDKLADAGIQHIEAGSFVKADKIPQLADTDLLFKKLNRRDNVVYSALVPNEKGMQMAVDAKVNEVAVFTAASETFCQKNIGCSIKESIERFKPVIDIAKNHNIRVRGYISCIFGCPYEGQIKIADVVDVAENLFKLGCHELSLGDTIGVGTPSQAQTLILHIAGIIPLDRLAVHFHDTRGQALANILSCLEMGISTIDSAIAGLGGCPYAQGASGNVATEDVVYMLHGLGIETGIDIDKLIDVGNFISEKLARSNNSRVGKAGVPPWIQHGKRKT